MASMTGALAAELEREAAVTRRLLERVPGDRLDWQPHARSMTLGRLTGHIAELAFWGRATLERPQVDLAEDPDRRGATAESVDRLLVEFDRNLAGFQEALGACSDEQLLEPWRLVRGEQVIFAAPRVAALRGFVLSHMIHHRGQLSVYLRLLDVPLPQIYGPTADDRGGFNG